MSDGVLASRGYVGRESSGIHEVKLADKTRRLGGQVNENVNYHPLRRCVICNELVDADDPTCAVCGQPACSSHAYDVGGGEWYCADCCHGKTHPCAECGAPSHWRCKDCGKWVCENHSTFVAVQGEEFYTLFGYYCDTDLRWELAEEIGRLPYLYSLLLA